MNIGKDLWTSDGTVDGTVKVKTFDNNVVYNMQGYAGKAFFSIQTDPNCGCYQLWRTDGTLDGTVSMSGTTSIYSFFILNDNVYYWTANLVRNNFDFNAEVQLPAMLIPNLAEFRSLQMGDKVYFTNASSGNLSDQLWVTDGTEAGTIKLYTNPNQKIVTNLTNVNGVLFFNADFKVHKTDGTIVGTALIKDFSSDAAASVHPDNFKALGNKLLFSAFTSTDATELWISDGTASETHRITNTESEGVNSASPNSIVTLGTKAFFSATGISVGNELFSTDGAIVSVVKDLDTTPGSSDISFIIPLRDEVYFTATSEGTGNELWHSNGTADDTRIEKDLNPAGSSTPYDFGKLDETTLVFSAFNGTGRQLYWNRDVPLIRTLDQYSTNRFFLKAIDGEAYFSAFDANLGMKLWISDGSVTSVLKDVSTATNSSESFGAFTKFKDAVYFAVGDYNTAANSGLWKTDGTTAGTVQVKQLTDIYKFCVVGNYMFFYGNDGVHGNELWKTDGTTEGTLLVKDINSSRSSLVSFGVGDPVDTDHAIGFQGKLFFWASENGTSQLWTSDGTAEGTKLFSPLQGYSLTTAGDKLFFMTNEGLVVTDGTAAGTIKLDGISGSDLCAVNNKLFYTSGTALKQSDGTVAGTFAVFSFAGNGPRSTAAKGDTLYFSADDGTHGRELWKFAVPPAPTITAFSTVNSDLHFTITGSNFSTTKSVFIGENSVLSFTIISDTEINVAIENKIASGILRVNTNGGSATKDGFNYYPVPEITGANPLVAFQNTAVTITGTNFSGTTALYFGETKASSFTVVSDTEISGLPDGGTTGDIKLITPGGETSLAGFEYYGPPVIESFTPKEGVHGTTVNIHGKNFYQILSVTLGDEPLATPQQATLTDVQIEIGAIAHTGKFKIVAASGTAISQESFTVQVITATAETMNAQKYVYPNPTNGKTFINYDGPDVHVNFYDSKGQRLNDVEVQQCANVLEADLTKLPAGLYIFILTSKSDTKTIRITKK
jgi:ELWxxDGT repeat protein